MTPPLLACLRQDGQVVADLDHDTYGNPEVSVETVKQPFRFTGREYDSETGLYYYRARMYDSKAGRFMQEDPIWLAAGDHNYYRYVWNNPMRYTDPSGMVAAIQYACFSEFGLGAGSTAGSMAGSAHNGYFSSIAMALAAVRGDLDRVDEIRQQAMITEAQILVAALAAEAALAVSRCGKARNNPQEPGTCGIGRGGKTPNSFATGTLVATKDGPKLIEEVRIGDQVSAWNPETDKADWKPVTAKSSRTASDLVKLTLKSASGAIEMLNVTSNHPMLRADEPGASNDTNPRLPMVSGTLSPLVPMEPAGFWTAAGQLKPRDRIRSASLGVVEVVSVESVLDSTSVLSFEVADHHSFAVGELGSWGHNAAPRGAPGGGKQKPGAYSTGIPAGRYKCSTKKEAYQRAKRASAPGQEPILADWDEKRCWHYHPCDARGRQKPDHYYFPRSRR